MKNRNIILGIILLLIILFSFIFINYKSRKIYYLQLPNYNKIVSISLDKNTIHKLISDQKHLKNIFNIFKNDYKTSETENNKANITDKIKVTFYYEDSIATNIYLYRIDNKYYLEQENNGIYFINKKIYNELEKYFD